MLDKLKSKLHPDIDNPASESEPSLKPHHTIKPCHLFPVPVKHAFTTLPDCTAHEAHIRVLTLSESALRVEKTTPGTSHRCVQVDGVQSWEALYPEGSINPQGKIKGGFGFYLCGPGGACAYESARDALFSYAIRFDEGFEFVKGGKIPGLCDRTNGAAEVYAYLPSTPANEAALKDVPPMTHRNPDFGWSVGRGCFKFQPGKWTAIAERVRLNEVGQTNGIIQLWADGELVLDVQGLEIRVDKDVVFRGAHFQTFFGGKAQDWASPKDQCTHFGCISGAVLEEW